MTNEIVFYRKAINECSGNIIDIAVYDSEVVEFCGKSYHDLSGNDKQYVYDLMRM